MDLGSWSFKLCAFNGEKLEVLTNEANFRETPSLVGYTATERLIGEPALIKLKTNFHNTIRAPQRLLALSKNRELLEEELKYEKVKYECGKDLVFSVEGRQGAAVVAVEEVLLSLLGKAKSIVESHGLALAIAYLAVPTYCTQDVREALLRCAELAFKKPVRLMDEWTALAAQYTYNRLKELKTLEEMRHVVFLDIGYSKVALSLVQFTRFEARLLDWEYLPFTGCKNMDERVCEFYSEHFSKAHKWSLLEHGKPFVKLLDAVQRERTVLSANNEYHLNLEYILNEEDLTYNMHRDEL
jgi:molecular chaperone DnaK (HSP70)